MSADHALAASVRRQRGTAEDAVGIACAELWPWALQFATSVLRASKHIEPAERMAALTTAAEVWPKLCRRVALIEEIAPNSTAAGFEADAAMQDLIEAIARQRQARAPRRGQTA